MSNSDEKSRFDSLFNQMADVAARWWGNQVLNPDPFYYMRKADTRGFFMRLVRHDRPEKSQSEPTEEFKEKVSRFVDKLKELLIQKFKDNLPLNASATEDGISFTKMDVFLYTNSRWLGKELFNASNEIFNLEEKERFTPEVEMNFWINRSAYGIIQLKNYWGGISDPPEEICLDDHNRLDRFSYIFGQEHLVRDYGIIPTEKTQSIISLADNVTKWWVSKLLSPSKYYYVKNTSSFIWKRKKTPRKVIQHAKSEEFKARVKIFEDLLKKFLVKVLSEFEAYVIYYTGDPGRCNCFILRTEDLTNILKYDRDLRRIASEVGFTDEDLMCFPCSVMMNIDPSTGEIYLEEYTGNLADSSTPPLQVDFLNGDVPYFCRL